MALSGPPFPVGIPAGPDDVVDREEFLAELVQRLGAGQSLMLAGPRRTGKSSVGLEALRRLRAAGVYTAAVDLFRVTSVEELAVELTAAVLANRTGPWETAVKSLSRLREALGELRVAAKVHDLELGVKLGERQLTPEAALDVALEAADRMAGRDGTRLVLLFDEFQEAARMGGTDLLRRLRGVLQQQRHLACLFLGSQPSLLRSLFTNRHAALYRFALPLELPPVPAAAWDQYLTRKLGGDGLAISGAAVRLLLERTGGHPWCVMEVVSEAWVIRGGERTLTAEHVALACDRAVRRLTPVYDAIWAEVRRVRYADAVLAAVAAGRGPYTLGLHHTAVTRAMRHLLEMAVLTRGPRRGEYGVVEPLFVEAVCRPGPQP